MQTAAANLGSMLTPVGNPQNIYLFSRYDFSLGSFLSVTLPIWVMIADTYIASASASAERAARSFPR